MRERPILLYAAHALKESAAMSETIIYFPPNWLPPANYEVTGRIIDGGPVYYCIRRKDHRAARVHFSESMAIPDNFDDYFSKTIGKEPDE
jgi:hypothetical protein